MEKFGLTSAKTVGFQKLGRRTFIRLVGTGLATLWIAAHCSLANAQPTTVTTATTDSGSVRISPLQAFNFLTLAQLDGLIDSQVKSTGGSVEWKPAFPAYVPTAEALRGGSIDIGSGSSTSFISAAADDQDLVVFAVERSSGKDQGIVATGASGIKTIEDLVGKKVAVNQGGTGEYLLRLALERHHIPIEKVNVVYLSPTDAATAFAQGQVDAWAVWEQFFAMGQAEPGAHVVAYASDIGSLNRNVHVTTRRFAKAHPLLVRAVYEAMRKEAEAVQSHPGRVAELNEKAGIPKEVADIIRQVPPSTIVPADEETLKEFNEIADFYTRSGITKKRIDVNNSLYNVASQE